MTIGRCNSWTHLWRSFYNRDQTFFQKVWYRCLVPLSSTAVWYRCLVPLFINITDQDQFIPFTVLTFILNFTTLLTSAPNVLSALQLTSWCDGSLWLLYFWILRHSFIYIPVHTQILIWCFTCPNAFHLFFLPLVQHLDCSLSIFLISNTNCKKRHQRNASLMTTKDPCNSPVFEKLPFHFLLFHTNVLFWILGIVDTVAGWLWNMPYFPDL